MTAHYKTPSRLYLFSCSLNLSSLWFFSFSHPSCTSRGEAGGWRLFPPSPSPASKYFKTLRRHNRSPAASFSTAFLRQPCLSRKVTWKSVSSLKRGKCGSSRLMKLHFTQQQLRETGNVSFPATSIKSASHSQDLWVTYLRSGFNLTVVPKPVPLLTLMPSINAAARSARHDLFFQRSSLPRMPPFVLISLLATNVSLTLLHPSLIVWQTSQREKDKYRFFPWILFCLNSPSRR